MQKTSVKTKILTIVAAILMLVSMIGASLVQSSGGKVEVTEVCFDTDFGAKMSALIYRPKTATEENPAPGIVCVHGMYNNKEMQDSNLVELSRRGYVVMAIDMFSHGDSDLLETADNLPMSGMAGLQYMLGLPYVDTSKIGMTGHSMGGLNCDLATQLCVDENGNSLVKALLLNCCFATYTDESGNYTDLYGATDVGIIADKYDEFLFNEVNSDGTALKPRDYIKSDKAQSFLNFGAPLEECEQRQADTVYYKEYDGREAMRVIYTPSYNHPWSHFSKYGAAVTIDFFDEALGSPVNISSVNQVWQWKEFFNFIGLVGLAVFAANVAVLLLGLKPFTALRTEAPARKITVKRKRWNYIAAGVASILSAALYIPITTGIKGDTTGKVIFSQASTFAIGAWVAVSGLLLILCMVAIQLANRGDGLTLRDMGISISAKKLGLSVLLGVVVVALSYLFVVLADVLFKTDFRIWFMAAKTMAGKIFLISLLPNVFLFLIYYLASSAMVNGFAYCDREKQGTNMLANILIAVFPALIIVVLQYVCLFSTGSVLFGVYNGSSAHSMILWLFPMLLLIPAAVAISRRIYRESRNPYIAAVINALMVSFITCANTSSWL